MPASRSRTLRWRDCLQQIFERNGGIELTLARPGGSRPASEGETPWPDAAPADLLWRVRLLSVTDDEIVVEQPAAMGQAIDLADGVDLVGVMSIGQNRWMFHTTTRGRTTVNGTRPTPGLRLSPPEGVERCARRQFDRISTASLHLPRVECWPLLNPGSVRPAEVANRATIEGIMSGTLSTTKAASEDRLAQSEFASGGEPLVLPEVGPRFHATLENLSGGGVGLRIDKGDEASLNISRLLWLRIDLRPAVPAPLAITCKIAHTHMDSAQTVHAGLAFEFGYHQAHRAFVVEQIQRVVNRVQAAQKKVA
ncbi:MAG: PilZ domain-containing protein [Phycisphaerales bacterium]|jgi:hypothetical protein|nr:PilZ domain-containing protein [Phycisphaerales bacterium]